jgi:hypothetical protein
MQDTTDLKSDILNEINFNKSILSEKRRHNFKLKMKLPKTMTTMHCWLSENSISRVENISLSNHTFEIRMVLEQYQS